MISLETAKRVAGNFKKEACQLLKIQEESVHLSFVDTLPIIEDIGKPWNARAADAANIEISEEFLNGLISRNGLTPLRYEIYTHVCLLWSIRNGHPVPLNLAGQYALALMILKGLTIPLPPAFDARKHFQLVLQFLKDCFGIEGRIVPVPKNVVPENVYTFQMSGDSAKRYLQVYSKPTGPIIPTIKDGEKGSLQNPFDNIDDAIEYVKRLEAFHYDQDELMQYISRQQYYYDVIHKQFRITWASPYVANVANDFPKNSFVMSEMNTGVFCLKPNLYKHKFLYRGQNDYYPGIPCVPNLFRSEEHNSKGYYLDYLILSQEMEILIKSHPLVQLLEKGIDLLHDTFKIRMNFSGLAQHYYNKSTYLDLTSNIEVAKFFATTDYCSKEDKFYPFKDKSKIGVIYIYNLEYPSAFQMHKGYALKNIGKQVFMRSGSQSGFLLQMEKGVDFKKLPEVRAIYFKHDDKIADDVMTSSHRGHDYFAEDLLQQAWVSRFKKRAQDKIVSLDAVKLNASRNPNESVPGLIRKLKKMNFKIDEYHPSFTEKELDMYYQLIKEGWWQEFCDDIYFNSPDGELYRQALREIPDREEYKWAFYK